MTEQLRKLLQSCGLLKPMRVLTDLSGAKVPSCAVTHKGRELLDEDILGRSRYREDFSFQLRLPAGGEADRQRAYAMLYRLGDWLKQPERTEWDWGTAVTALGTAEPAMQEAYDDGTAVWSMGIKIYKTE